MAVLQSVMEKLSLHAKGESDQTFIVGSACGSIRLRLPAGAVRTNFKLRKRVLPCLKRRVVALFLGFQSHGDSGSSNADQAPTI